jgi:hypothetical protein
LDDRALFCTEGDLETASKPFGRPDRGDRDSPWCKTSSRLHTLNSARYRDWCAGEWERIHAGPTSWIDEKGQTHKMPRDKIRSPHRN